MPTRQRAMMLGQPWLCKPPALRLPDLDDDVLSLVAEALAHESSRESLGALACEPLCALALVSRRFRCLYAPILFREITWISGAGAVPRGVAAHIRILRVTSHRDSVNWAALVGSIPSMTLLREVSFEVSTPVPQQVWRALALLPSLHTLRTSGFPTSLPRGGFEASPPRLSHAGISGLSYAGPPALPCVSPPGLTRLLLGVGDVRVAGADRLAPPELALLVACAREAIALLEGRSGTLEEVKIPAQLLSRGVPSLPLPALRKLTLTGTLPDTVRIHDLLRLTPHLRDLSVLWTLARDAEYGPVLFDRDEARGGRHGEVERHDMSLRTLTPSLRTLALSNLHPADGVLDDLPASLEALTLVSVAPVAGTTRGLSEEQAFAVVGALVGAGGAVKKLTETGEGVRALAKGEASASEGVSALPCKEVGVMEGRPLADLRELRLFTRAQAPVALVRAIVRAFPRLRTLQVGIDEYRPARAAYTPVWAQFAEALAPLHDLRKLYLGLDLPAGVHVEDYAEFFCRRLPMLEVVGMQVLLGAAGMRARSPSHLPSGAPPHPPSEAAENSNANPTSTNAQARWTWASRVEWSCSYVTRLGRGEYGHRCGTYMPLEGVF